MLVLDSLSLSLSPLELAFCVVALLFAYGLRDGTGFGGALRVRTLYTVPGRLIVQAWRSGGWKKGDLDSTLVLRFTPKGRSGRIDLIHANVPDHDYRGVNNGWKNYYWRPWRKYLKD